ncbi:MAG: hypothetical protein QOH07_2245, partial [Mycobacterium sp.]|nr:hypothetical protein [Mycobacterium sp.]
MVWHIEVRLAGRPPTARKVLSECGVGPLPLCAQCFRGSFTEQPPILIGKPAEV